jgi:hypothetical protein
MIKPFDRDCKGYIHQIDANVVKYEVNYFGMTISNWWRGGSYELIRDFDCDSHIPPEENLALNEDRNEICANYECVLALEPSFYLEKNLETGWIGTKEAVWMLTDSPWPGFEACKQQMRTRPWYTTCDGLAAY